MRKSVGLSAVLVMLLFALTGCASLLPGPEDTNPYLNLFLIAADTGDYGIFLDQCTPGLRGKMNSQATADISEYMQGSVTEYKRVDFQYNTVRSNGSVFTTKRVRYMVTTDIDRYYITLVLISDNNILYQINEFYIVNSADTKAAQGRVIDFQRLELLQVIPLLLTIASLGLIAAGVVLSAKADIRNKALWILISLLGTVGLIHTHTPNRFHIQFSAIATLPLSYCTKYPDGSFILRVMLPVGAVIFLLLRKQLMGKKAAYDARNKHTAVSVESDVEHTPE